MDAVARDSPGRPTPAGERRRRAGRRFRRGDLRGFVRELPWARRDRPRPLAGRLRGGASGLLGLRFRRPRTGCRLDRRGARRRSGPGLQRNDARLPRRTHRGAAGPRDGVHSHPLHRPELAAGRAQSAARPAHREGLPRGRVGGGGGGGSGGWGRGLGNVRLRTALRVAQPGRGGDSVRLAEGRRRPGRPRRSRRSALGRGGRPRPRRPGAGGQARTVPWPRRGHDRVRDGGGGSAHG